MLRHLYVRNLAVMAEASLELKPGLNVVTGETGAGKSLVVDSLALLSGARARADLVRTGADVLTVSGVFQPVGDRGLAALEEAGVQVEGDELVVRREVARSGRNRIFVNDQPVTLRLLTEVAPHLIRIHGQGEELGLLAPDLQREWLDRQGGEAGRKLRQACADGYERYRALAERLERLTGNDRLRHERLDLLRFQAGEIDAAEVGAGEERELRTERDVLRHGEAIIGALGGAFGLLTDDEGAASDSIGRARTLLQDIADWEPQAVGWADELHEVAVRVDELARSLRDRLDRLDADPQRLNAIEDRLALLERLLRKYGPSSEEILVYRARIGDELAELEMDDSQRETLEEETGNALEQFRETATKLSRSRRRWGADLVRRVEAELRELGLDKAKFSVRLEVQPRTESALRIGGEPVAFGRHGYDRVVFEFAPNPGEEPRPLARVASGGELSRVYLALQVVARGEGEAAAVTMIFDEVDSGVGGLEAARIGRKLKRLAAGGQILAVTHLPQVASCGDAHFRLSKGVVGKRTEVEVQEVVSDRRVAEVARMLAGETVTSTSLSHAQELLTAAAQDEGA